MIRQPMTIVDRVEAFKLAYPDNPAAWPWIVQEQDRDVLYAVWLPGNCYERTGEIYGSYPRDYVKRIMALFPDVAGTEADYTVLHAFSGSLPKGPYRRCDVKRESEHQCRVEDLPLQWPYSQGHQDRLILADPPYTKQEAENKYGTDMIVRPDVMRVFADITAQNGHVVWLDEQWPMHRKEQWVTVGRIFVVISTNHRFRGATIFQRVSGGGSRAREEPE